MFLWCVQVPAGVSCGAPSVAPTAPLSLCSVTSLPAGALARTDTRWAGPRPPGGRAGRHHVTVSRNRMGATQRARRRRLIGSIHSPVQVPSVPPPPLPMVHWCAARPPTVSRVATSSVTGVTRTRCLSATSCAGPRVASGTEATGRWAEPVGVRDP